MWTQENRGRYDRRGQRFPSDLTDAEWALIEPLIAPAKRGGNKRTVDLRAVVDGLLYVLSTGCQWRALPTDLPPRATVHGYLDRWDYDGTLARIHHTLFMACREQAGRAASPTAAILDSQSVKGAEKGGRRSTRRATMPGKTIRGKKRHILVDTQGLVMHALVHPASVQDRTGGVWVMATLFGLYPFLLRLYADGGYQGPAFKAGLRRVCRRLKLTIVKRSKKAQGFVVLPKRWIVERTFAWLNRCRRLAKDWECRSRTARAFLLLASIRLMTRKLCQTTI
ncbi:IS5 family transposase [Methylobacterium amylolyticum]|uniref:IS5 family transposase n=1 Tax=Methylobacterium sp. NEAU 140 TaxID=3064945 RepID=UPI003520B40B